MRIVADTDEYEIVEFAFGESLPHELVRVRDTNDSKWGVLQRLVLDKSYPISDKLVHAYYTPEVETHYTLEAEKRT
jgi:hypothetical protein